jgi:hypothetical protein
VSLSSGTSSSRRMHDSEDEDTSVLNMENYVLAQQHSVTSQILQHSASGHGNFCFQFWLNFSQLPAFSEIFGLDLCIYFRIRGFYGRYIAIDISSGVNSLFTLLCNIRIL